MKKVLLEKATIIFMKWHYLSSFFRFKRNYITLLILGSFLSCGSLEKDRDTEIVLKWNASYPKETIDDAAIGLKWCLSFLGADGGKEAIWKGITQKGNLFIVQTDSLYFSKDAINHLTKLNAQLKQTEEYQETGAIDLGRYIALTIGSPYHYYKIAAVPDQLETFKANYTFDTIQGYINNSGVSRVHRLISYAKNMSGSQQAYLSTEIDSISK